MLIVLLVAAVALGFGLSIISRSTTDVKISEQEDQASRAFNAAEAGIEAGLQNLAVGTYPLPPVAGITGQYSVTGVNVLKLETLSENDVATVVLGGANTLTVEWGEACPGTASLEIAVIDKDGNVKRDGINACTGYDNGLTDISTPGTDGYLRSRSVTVGVDDRLVRIRPIYSQTKLRVYGSIELPPQVYQVNSTAQATTLESKAINVTRTEPAAPAIFDYALFSGTNLVQ